MKIIKKVRSKKVRRFVFLLRDAVPASQLVCHCRLQARVAALVVFHPPRAKGKARAVEEPEERSGGISRAVRRRRGHLRLPPRCLRTNDAGCFAPAPSRIVASTLSRAVRRRRGHLRLPPRCLRTNDAGCFAPAPSRIVASTLVSCRQAGARPATPRREKKEKEQSSARPSRTGGPEPNFDVTP